MKLKKVNLKDGFTIIEVVLVLAIAGLIFLMVFIALPALQRSQRDTQRRDDIARANTALAQFMANNRNNVPNEFSEGEAPPSSVGTGRPWGSCDPVDPSGFCGNYLLVGGDSFEDPDGTAYTFMFAQVFTTTGGAPTTPTTPTSPELPGEGEGGGEPAGSGYAGNMPTEFDHNIYVSYNAKCNGEIVERSTGVRKIALQYKLEGGGVVCVNN
jgi:prepilin-type N-terminal cleavage/methylation domain-containing protein